MGTRTMALVARGLPLERESLLVATSVHCLFSLELFGHELDQACTSDEYAH